MNDDLPDGHVPSNGAPPVAPETDPGVEQDRAAPPPPTTPVDPPPTTLPGPSSPRTSPPVGDRSTTWSEPARLGGGSDDPEPEDVSMLVTDHQEAPAPAPAEPGPRRPLPRVMAIANQKGGVGKTTTAVNLGACLAELGYRTLVVDLDPQGNASTGLGINVRSLEASMYDVLLGDTPMEDCLEASSVRNLFVAPASLDLAGAEIELVPAFSREMRLRNAIGSVKDDFDYVLIDCPPSLGLLTINAFAAAGEVLVPIQCEYYALEGLGQLVRNVDLVKRNLNDALEISTIVLVMYDARTKLADQVADEVREHFGDKVCRQIVPRTVRLSEAPSFGQPIITFDPSSRGAIAYRQLAKEVSGGPS
jgi:chromosome partitioning protein